MEQTKSYQDIIKARQAHERKNVESLGVTNGSTTILPITNDYEKALAERQERERKRAEQS